MYAQRTRSEPGGRQTAPRKGRVSLPANHTVSPHSTIACRSGPSSVLRRQLRLGPFDRSAASGRVAHTVRSAATPLRTVRIELRTGLLEAWPQTPPKACAAFGIPPGPKGPESGRFAPRLRAYSGISSYCSLILLRIARAWVTADSPPPSIRPISRTRPSASSSRHSENVRPSSVCFSTRK